MCIQNVKSGPDDWVNREPFIMNRHFLFLNYNRALSALSTVFVHFAALAAQSRKAIFTLFVQNGDQNRLDSAPRVVFREQNSLVRLKERSVRYFFASRCPFDEMQSVRFAFAGFVKKVLTVMASDKNKPVRTTITLTDAEVDALKNLRGHFDTQSVSETIRRSIAQSSLLKRYSDEEGDLLVERDGKKFVIPSRR